MLDKNVYYYFLDELEKEAFYGKALDYFDKKTLDAIQSGIDSKNKKIRKLSQKTLESASGMHDPTSKNPIHQGLRAV